MSDCQIKRPQNVVAQELHSEVSRKSIDLKGRNPGKSSQSGLGGTKAKDEGNTIRTKGPPRDISRDSHSDAVVPLAVPVVGS